MAYLTRAIVNRRTLNMLYIMIVPNYYKTRWGGGGEGEGGECEIDDTSLRV